jgi:signal transduction histidine kinase
MDNCDYTPTLLIIDEDSNNLKILNNSLINSGYNVKVVEDRDNVIKQIKVCIPDLILLDFMLNGSNIFDVCQQLKADPLTQTIPIIVMKPCVDPVVQMSGLKVGDVDYINKPFEEQELLARVRHHLDLKNLRIALETKNQELTKLTTELENKIAQQKEALKIALAKEQELNHLKSRLISMASHEFRTPLAIISSSSGILQNFSDRLDEARKREHFQTIQKTIKQVTQILDNLLMINPVATANLELNLEIIDIIDFCQQLKAEIEASINTHRIDLSFDLGSENLSDSLMIQGDQIILRQILTHLLTNAIKYSPDYKIVKFRLNIENNQLIFQITDRGIGIPEAEQSLIFKSFYQASNVGTIAGIGLGLSIVKKYVDLLNGNISLYSCIGEGTKFTVQIPFQRG